MSRVARLTPCGLSGSLSDRKLQAVRASNPHCLKLLAASRCPGRPSTGNRGHPACSWLSLKPLDQQLELLSNGLQLAARHTSA